MKNELKTGKQIKPILRHIIPLKNQYIKIVATNSSFLLECNIKYYP